MPIFPARAEKKAPKINAGTIIQLVVSTKVEIAKRAAEAITTNIKRSRYSALRKARAPSLIALDISCIFSFPGLCFLTHAILISINISPTQAKAIGT